MKEASQTAPVLNKVKRYRLGIDIFDHVSRLSGRSFHVRQKLQDKLIEHRQFIAKTGDDLPKVKNWEWEL